MSRVPHLSRFAKGGDFDSSCRGSPEVAGAASLRFSGCGFCLSFFACSSPAPPPVTLAPLPFILQFRPFPVFHLAYRYSHAILSRVRRTQSSPTRLPPKSSPVSLFFSERSNLPTFQPAYGVQTRPKSSPTSGRSFVANTTHP